MIERCSIDPGSNPIVNSMVFYLSDCYRVTLPVGDLVPAELLEYIPHDLNAINTGTSNDGLSFSGTELHLLDLLEVGSPSSPDLSACERALLRCLSGLKTSGFLVRGATLVTSTRIEHPWFFDRSLNQAISLIRFSKLIPTWNRSY